MLVPLAASPAAAATHHFRWPAGRLSPLFGGATCTYRILWGNYGNVPFAKWRVYGPGSCSYRIHVRYTDDGARFRSSEAPGYTGRGHDRCGGYQEKQATGPAGNIATSMVIEKVGQHLQFWDKYGSPTDDLLPRDC